MATLTPQEAIEYIIARELLMTGPKATPPKHRAIVKMVHFIRLNPKVTKYPPWRQMKRTSVMPKHPRELRFSRV